MMPTLLSKLSPLTMILVMHFFASILLTYYIRIQNHCLLRTIGESNILTCCQSSAHLCGPNNGISADVQVALKVEGVFAMNRLFARDIFRLGEVKR